MDVSRFYLGLSNSQDLCKKLLELVEEDDDLEDMGRLLEELNEVVFENYSFSIRWRRRRVLSDFFCTFNKGQNHWDCGSNRI